MTFDIKKLSTAFVVALLFAGKATADTPDLSEHDQAVLRATNVFYNLFATNALQAARVVVSGNTTTQNLFVEGDETITGTLFIDGAEVINGVQEINGGLTVHGNFVQDSGTVNMATQATGANTFGSAATTATLVIGGASQTGALTLGNSTAGQTVNVGTGANTAANTVNIATGAPASATSTVNILTTAASAGTSAQTLNAGNAGQAANAIVLQAGTTGKILYNVGAVAGTNYQLNPIGSAETAAQRMAWAQVSSAGAVSATSGVNNGAAGASGHFGITWSNAFAVAPTLSLTQVGGTGIVFRFTASTTGATVDTLENISAASAATNVGFNVVAIGS